MNKFEVSLSRAHKIAERLKDLMKQGMDEAQALGAVVRFNAKPAPSAQSKLDNQGEEVWNAYTKSVTYAEAWASVRSVIARENKDRGIDSMLTTLEALNKQLACLKSLAALAKAEGYKPSEMNLYEFTQKDSVYQGLVVNPLGEASLKDRIAKDLARAQARAIQLSDQIAEANAARVALELPQDIINLVTGGSPT